MNPKNLVLTFVTDCTYIFSSDLFSLPYWHQNDIICIAIAVKITCLKNTSLTHYILRSTLVWAFQRPENLTLKMSSWNRWWANVGLMWAPNVSPHRPARLPSNPLSLYKSLLSWRWSFAKIVICSVYLDSKIRYVLNFTSKTHHGKIQSPDYVSLWQA